MEVAARPRRVVPAEWRLVVRVAAGAHLAAGRQTLVSGARVRRVGRLAAGRWSAAKHVRLVPGSELLADSFAVLQHGQSRRSRLQYNVSTTRIRIDLFKVVTINLFRQGGFFPSLPSISFLLFSLSSFRSPSLSPPWSGGPLSDLGSANPHQLEGTAFPATRHVPCSLNTPKMRLPVCRRGSASNVFWCI